MKSEIQIVSTKRLSSLQRSLLKHPIKVIDNDFIAIEYLSIDSAKISLLLPTVIFTSQNAVKSLLSNCSRSQLSFKAIYCVGEKTKQLLEENNFEVTHFEKYGSDLADFIINQKDISEVTFFCGEIRLDEIPHKLTANNIKVNELIVYKTVLNNIIITETVDGILFYSPSGVQSYVLAKNSVKPKAFCIGDTTAQTASTYFSEVVVSDNPTVEDVIHKVNQYYV
jgi:uroporphyrinogen-III synthase